jgi:nucleotide-binding universal stress UspA family protein
MFRNVLIGIDGREGGRDALALARLLAASDAKPTLAHVCAPDASRGVLAVSAAERAGARMLLEHERELAGDDANLAVTGPRDVGHGLHELAEDCGADLIVVGSTRHGPAGRALVGDDCRAALDGAPCAVAVAPQGYSLAPHRLQQLGVGYDASPESELALSTACDLASAGAETITVLWVVSLEDVREEKPIPADWPSATDDLVDRRTKQLAQLEGVRGVAAYDGPREALVRFGEDLDLLVLGSRRYGTIARMVHGSVSRYVVRHAACPVLVVPRPPVTSTVELDREAHLVAAGG